MKEMDDDEHDRQQYTVIDTRRISFMIIHR